MKGKVQQIREAWQNMHPDKAADLAVQHFEAAAIKLPDVLLAAPSDPSWRQRLLEDAAATYRCIVMAGPDGVDLKELRGGKGSTASAQQRRALRYVRESGTVIEGRREVSGLLFLRALQ